MPAKVKIRIPFAIAVLAMLAIGGGRALAQSATQHGILLSWQESTAGVTFDVWRSTSASGPFVQINSAPITGTTYLDAAANLAAGQTYVYEITAVQGEDSSGPSNQISVAVPSAGFPVNPAAPTNGTGQVQ